MKRRNLIKGGFLAGLAALLGIKKAAPALTVEELHDLHKSVEERYNDLLQVRINGVPVQCEANADYITWAASDTDPDNFRYVVFHNDEKEGADVLRTLDWQVPYLTGEKKLPPLPRANGKTI